MEVTMLIRLSIIFQLMLCCIWAEPASRRFSHIPYPQVEHNACTDVEEELLQLAKDVFFSANLWSWQQLDNLKVPPSAAYEIILQGTACEANYSSKYSIYYEQYNFNNEFIQLIKPPKNGWIRENEYHYRLKQPNYGGYFVVSIHPFRSKTLTSLLWVGNFNDAAYKKMIAQMYMPSIPIKKETIDPSNNYVRVWQHVILLHIKKNNKIIAIDPEFYEIGTWRIYIPKGDGTLGRCIVRFRDNHEKLGIDLFPEGAFKEFCKLLDQAIGYPSDWGNGMMPPREDFLRGEAMLSITNAAIRPWVFLGPEKPYIKYCHNTRAELDEGLKKWSRKHPEYAQQYQQIKQLYPEAEKDLAKYYQGYLKVNKDTAKQYAKRILDIIYRAHFRF